MPIEFNATAYLEMALPGDVTLRDARAAMTALPAWKIIDDAAKGKARVRFLMVDSTEAPDTMLMRDFRRLVAGRLAGIIIDDGQGGELVS